MNAGLMRSELGAVMQCNAMLSMHMRGFKKKSIHFGDFFLDRGNESSSVKKEVSPLPAI